MNEKSKPVDLSTYEDSKESVLLEILKQKLAKADGLMAHYMRAFAFYLAITGALLKFSLDASSTHSLRVALSGFGIIMSLLAIMVSILGERLRRAVKSDIEELYARLNIPLVPDKLISILYVTITGSIFNFICLGVWIYLIL